MMADFFTVGDRVRLCATRHTVQAGALGTVQEVLGLVNAYIIAFDGLVGPRFVWGKILERVYPEAPIIVDGSFAVGAPQPRQPGA